MDEADQGHIHVLTDGLTGEGEMAVNAGLRSSTQLVERQCAGGGRGGHALFQDDCIQAECLDHQGGFEIEWGEIQYALPETHIRANQYNLSTVLCTCEVYKTSDVSEGED